MWKCFVEESEAAYAPQGSVEIQADEGSGRLFPVLSESYFRLRLRVELGAGEQAEELPAGMRLQAPAGADRVLLAAGALWLQASQQNRNAFAGTPFAAASADSGLFPTLHQCLRTPGGAFVCLQSHIRIFKCSHAFPHPATQNFVSVAGLNNEKI